MNTYGRPRDTSGSSSDLAEARALVIRFLADLRDHPIGHDILDASELPAPRTAMIEAFCLLIGNEPRFRIRDQLKLVGLVLSQFQDGVGPRLQVQAAPAPAEEPQPAPADIPAVRRMERALAAVEPDRIKLINMFDRAAEQAKSASAGMSQAQAWRSQAQSAHREEWMTR